MRDLVERPFHDVVKEYEHWVVLFREHQVTIGSLVIMNRDMSLSSLGQVSSDAWSEFGTVCAYAENLLKKAFDAEKFNYLALMMKDPEVHFHLIPRYSRPVEFEGQTFVDSDWPSATKKITLELDYDLKDKIYRKIMEVAL